MTDENLGNAPASESTASNQGDASTEIRTKLWNIANTLRGKSSMEASEFKNYALGVIFYKFLSEKIEDKANELLAEDGVTFVEAYSNPDLQAALVAEIEEQAGYFIPPQHLFSAMVTEINKGVEGTFDVALLQEAINSIIASTQGLESEDDFQNLFDDMDLTSTKLGKDVKTRSEFMAKIILELNTISFKHADTEIDILGDAYEFMISQFAATAGKKAGEFYTPQPVSKLLAKIVSHGRTEVKSIYDPTCGSGSLLLRVAKELKVGHIYGQELIGTTYNLARMNMMLHGVPYNKFTIHNGDTLKDPAFMETPGTMGAVVANPPYSIDWEPDNIFNARERFEGYPKMAPRGTADFAFIQTGIYALDDEGTMAVVLPHGVLFRGGAEESIRKTLLEKNYIDAIIGLPKNLFFGATLATLVLVIKKCRKPEDKILVIDASQEFDKGKNQNFLSDAHVEKMFQTYGNRTEIEKYSVLVDMATIQANDYNLNIPRYIDVSEEGEIIDLAAVQARLAELDAESSKLEAEFNAMLANLVKVSDE